MIGAGGTYSNKLKVWNLQSGVVIKTFCSHSAGLDEVAISPDGKFVASVSGHGRSLKTCDLKSGNVLKSFRGHFINTVAYSPSGKWIAIGSDDGYVGLFDAKTLKLVNSFRAPEHVNKVVFSPSGKALLSGSYDGTIKIWNTQDGSLIGILQHDKSVDGLAVLNDGRIISGGILKVWGNDDLASK